MSDTKPKQEQEASVRKNNKEDSPPNSLNDRAVNRGLRDTGDGAKGTPSSAVTKGPVVLTDSITLPPYGFAEDILKKVTQGYTVEKTIGPATTAADEGLMSGQSASHNMKYVTFFLNEEEYGIPIYHVWEINRLIDITRVPNTSPFIRGVINLRGRIVPVLDLKEKLNLGTTVTTKLSRIMIVELGQIIIGLIVDRVSTVMSLNSEQIELPAEELFQQKNNYIQGVGKCDDRMILILALDRILKWQA